MTSSLSMCAASALLAATLITTTSADFVPYSGPHRATALQSMSDMHEDIDDEIFTASTSEKAPETLPERYTARGPGPAPEEMFDPEGHEIRPFEQWVWAGCHPVNFEQAYNNDGIWCDCHCGVFDPDCLTEYAIIPDDCMCAPEVEAMAKRTDQFCEVSLALAYCSIMFSARSKFPKVHFTCRTAIWLLRATLSCTECLSCCYGCCCILLLTTCDFCQ